jgi:hypothetical protein
MYVCPFRVIKENLTTGCQTGFRPHFHVYFMVSYGLDRRQLEEVNFLFKNTETVPYCAAVVHKSHAHFLTQLLIFVAGSGILAI